MNNIIPLEQKDDIQKSVGTEMAVSRQAQEVQATMVVAKRFPRDEYQAVNKILKSCSRKSLAEQAHYTYPRGNEKVIGPSIRLAEAIAQSWGNIDYGIIELDQKNGKSEMMAYAWDLETNTRSTKIFSVPHRRDTKNGSKNLTDARDIYEIGANMGARRVRSCILAVIPGDIIDSAEEQCFKTLAGAYTEPLTDRLRNMLKAFDSDFQVSKELIEKFVGYTMDRFTEQDYLKLKGVWKAIKDGQYKREQYFDIKPVSEASESPLQKESK